MHGLKNDNGEIFLEVSGYTISVYDVNGTVDDEATIRLVKNLYGLGHILRTYTDPTLRKKNKIIEGLIDTPDLPVQISQKCFLLQKDDKTITVLYLETSLDRDIEIEKEILTALLNGKLTSRISHEKAISKITLAGKKINLLVEADWIAPHKVVNEDAQVSWSEFSSESRANQYISNQIIIDKASNVDYAKDEEIEILFDKKTVIARRIVYYDSSNETHADYLIVYYFVYSLRGQSVACILSCYENSEDVLSLPPLLESVMQIASVSGSVEQPIQMEYPFYSVASFDAKNKYNGENNYFYSYRFEFQLGSILPFGNLRNVYSVAPSLGFYCSIPLFYRVGLDLGFQGAIPVKSGFDYYYSDGSAEHTKSTGILGVNMRGRYLVHQTGGWIFSGYVGIGANWLFTNIANEDSYDWETDSYRTKYAVAALDVFPGCNISYKKIGLFVEYHLTPYGNSNKVKYDFGKNSFNLGVTFTTGWDL
jgi:hypothetical protein